MPDFGTVRENEAAFEVAVAYIASGDIECGRSILTALRDHICSTGEQKSVRWILPKVLETLEAFQTWHPPSNATLRGGGAVAPRALCPEGGGAIVALLTSSCATTSFWQEA